MALLALVLLAAIGIVGLLGGHGLLLVFLVLSLSLGLRVRLGVVDYRFRGINRSAGLRHATLDLLDHRLQGAGLGGLGGLLLGGGLVVLKISIKILNSI